MSLEAIDAQARRLRADFGFVALVASEIEFYLPGAHALESLEPLWRHVRGRCVSEGIGLCKIEQERGFDQFEIALVPAAPAQTASGTETLKTIVQEAARACGITADFAAKPFPDQPGSGLHIHLSLHDETGRNVYFKRDSIMNDALRFSLGGLIALLPHTMLAYAPNAQSYARFAPGGNAPVTVSWGANNRTVAIRLPDKDPQQKHIEHRVAGADADPALVITAMLASVHYGLSHRCDPGPQIHGDASLAMYGLRALPGTLEEAKLSAWDPITLARQLLNC